MKVYSVTHPEFPKSLMRIAVDAQDRVGKLYITGPAFIATGCAALLAPDTILTTALPASAYIASLTQLGCKVREDKPELATNEKVALWCRLWKAYKGTPWNIGGPDAKRLGEMKIDEELLRWYLNDAGMPQTAQTWLWRGKQSIANLYHYYNQVKVAMAAPPPSKHPDHWSREHLVKLDGQGIGEYHRHLRSLGLVPKHHRDGSIIDYIKPSP